MDLQRGAGALADFIKYLLTPEPSNGAHVRPAEAAWMNTAKSFFWAALSVGVGMLLASLCS